MNTPSLHKRRIGSKARPVWTGASSASSTSANVSSQVASNAASNETHEKRIEELKNQNKRLAHFTNQLQRALYLSRKKNSNLYAETLRWKELAISYQPALETGVNPNHSLQKPDQVPSVVGNEYFRRRLNPPELSDVQLEAVEEIEEQSEEEQEEKTLSRKTKSRKRVKKTKASPRKTKVGKNVTNSVEATRPNYTRSYSKESVANVCTSQDTQPDVKSNSEAQLQKNISPAQTMMTRRRSTLMTNSDTQDNSSDVALYDEDRKKQPENIKEPDTGETDNHENKLPYQDQTPPSFRKVKSVTSRIHEDEGKESQPTKPFNGVKNLKESKLLQNMRPLKREVGGFGSSSRTRGGTAWL